MNATLLVLEQWFDRVVKSRVPLPAKCERRLFPRRECHDSLTLIPVERYRRRLMSNFVVRAVLKDESLGGLGILTTARLCFEYYFAENGTTGKVYLLRLVRHFPLAESEHEYGMRILDSFQSLDELQAYLEVG